LRNQKKNATFAPLLKKPTRVMGNKALYFE